MAIRTKQFKIALCQTLVSPDKHENFTKVADFVHRAAEGGAKIACLPEIWNAPYNMKKLSDYAESADGETVSFMRELAKKEKILLIGGSIPEKDGGKIYNTCFAFSREGELLARHRKTHLFDVDIEGGVRFKESDFFTAGDAPEGTVFDTEFGKIGLAICFDMRFPAMSIAMAKAGASLIFLPASFNLTTGPAHWDLLIRARALDSQLYFAACAPARDENASYVSYGHSRVASPWGAFIAEANERETLLLADIDLAYMDKVRIELPIR